MTTWVDGFKKALLDLVQGRDEEAVEVIDWEEATEQGGYCETCYYEDVLVEIEYRTADGDRKTYRYYGKFWQLVQELTRDA